MYSIMVALLKQLFSCSCSPAPIDDDENNRKSEEKWNQVEQEINANRDRVGRLESRMNVNVERLESKIDMKIEMMSNKIDNVLMILNNRHN
jgi:hypothetical protein